MKAILAVMGVVFLSVTSFGAVDSTVNNVVETRISAPGEISVVDAVQEFVDGDRASACEASVGCPNGRTIGCTANGYQTRCQRSSRHVSCEAWGSDGSYSRSTDACRH